jgi:hypothetical protein
MKIFGRCKIRLTIDKSGCPVQYFSAMPMFNKPPATLLASGSVDTSMNPTDRVTVSIADEGVGWIRFRSTGDVLVYFNSDTANTMYYDANTMHDLMLNAAILSVTFINTTDASVTLYRQGM